MASGTGHSKEIEELKLKRIGTFWFLDIGGKLKRLAILDNAQNVSLVNNVIFAGDKLYQVFTSKDSEIVVSEIEDIRATTNTAQKIKRNNTVSDIDRSDNGENSGSAENDPNNAETNEGRDDMVNETEDACRNSSYDTETSFGRSGDSESVRSAENVPNNALSSSDDTNLYAFVTKSERDNEFSSDSDEDYNLEKGHEEYIEQKEKGIFRGIFQLLKKAVRRNQDERQKMLNKKAEPLYEDVPYGGRESAASNIGSDIEDEGRTDEDMTNITTNTDEVQGAKIVTALYDFEAFLDDEISFKKSDRFKICGGGNSSDSEWCSAEHLRTGRKGYIPRAYVTNNMSSLENMECWFNVDVHASERLLLSSDFPPGTFLLRPSSGTSMCALSMLFRDEGSEHSRVVHYRIKQHMGEVFISANISFFSISELLDYFKSKKGLKCNLRGTVPKDPPIVYPRQMEVTRKSLGQMSFYAAEVEKQLSSGVEIENVNIDLRTSYIKAIHAKWLVTSANKLKERPDVIAEAFSKAGKLFNTLDVTIAKLSTEEMTTEEFREAMAVLHNFRDSKAKIVRMIAVSFDPESYFVVLGETINCTLKEYLHTNGNKMLNRNVLFQYAAQVADGMAFLERNSVINRYLRADCVFVCYPYIVKIAHPKLNDLIFGSVASGNVQDPFEMDKWKWTAPEAINDEQKYSTKSDVWSYGVLLYELITFGEEPYKGLSAEEALHHLGKGNRPQRPYNSKERCPLAFYVTMLKCWHERPECRPTFEFLRELFLDFDNIELLDIGSEELTSCGKIVANAATVIKQQTKQESGDADDDLCCKLEIPCPKVRPLVQLRELEVSRESVKLLKKLGSGCFGEMYAGKWRETVDVTVKKFKEEMPVDDFLAEAMLMHHLRHNKLVQLMAVCTKSEPILIITEFMVNGHLLEYLRKDEGKSLQFKDLADMAGQIADGMVYLEMENCVHRDLRAANILVGDHNEVKIGDFGFARLIQEGIYEAQKNTMIPLKWTAPEAAFDRKFSIKSDVWSFGVLLYELITFGKVPYPRMNGHEVLNRVEKGFRMPKPTGGPVPCPEPYYEIMLKCWNRVADSRPTFEYLLDFFNNYMASAEGEYRPIDD